MAPRVNPATVVNPTAVSGVNPATVINLTTGSGAPSPTAGAVTNPTMGSGVSPESGVGHIDPSRGICFVLQSLKTLLYEGGVSWELHIRKSK